MQTFKQIKEQVGAWNILNFGNQVTPYLRVVPVAELPDADHKHINNRHGGRGMVTELGSLAPLMGMMEELGELYEADAAHDPTDAKDATGDIAVYLCDYCCREGIAFPAKPTPPGVFVGDDHLAGMVIHLGRLYHCTLKRHQGIRGMADDAAYAAARDDAVNAFAWHLHTYAHAPRDINLLTILNETWHKVVKKRDWRADPKDGGGHNHGKAE